MSADTLQQLSEKIKGLEQQMTTVLTQGEEEEMGLHRFNRELLSKLKKSHQEKRELVDQLDRESVPGEVLENGRDRSGSRLI